MSTSWCHTNMWFQLRKNWKLAIARRTMTAADSSVINVWDTLWDKSQHHLIYWINKDRKRVVIYITCYHATITGEDNNKVLCLFCITCTWVWVCLIFLFFPPMVFQTSVDLIWWFGSLNEKFPPQALACEYLFPSSVAADWRGCDTIQCSLAGESTSLIVDIEYLQPHPASMNLVSQGVVEMWSPNLYSHQRSFPLSWLWWISGTGKKIKQNKTTTTKLLP